MQPQRSLVPEEYHGSAWVADRAIDYLDSNRGRQPFLMWAGFIHPHPPFDILESYAGLYRGKVEGAVSSETPLSTLAKENITLGCLEDPKETRNLLYGEVQPEVLQIRGRLKETLTSYEARYGLKDGVVGGKLVKREPYQMERARLQGN